MGGMSAGLEVGRKSWMSSGKEQGQIGIHEDKLQSACLSSPPPSTMWVTCRKKLAAFATKPHTQLAQATQSGRRSAGGEATEAQLLPLATEGAGRSAATWGAARGGLH